MSAETSNMTENLRMRAENLLAQATETFLPADIVDINKLHHELAVHQAELELQNDELRNTQLSLQKVRDRYVELYEHAPVGYVLLDAAGIIRHTNSTWRAALKRPDKDFRGTPFAETLVEDDARVFLSRFRSLFHNPAEKQIELQIKRHNTKPFHAHITAKRSIGVGTENDTNELMIIVSDITERKQAEIYRDIGREILQILNEPNDLQESIQRVLTTLKTGAKVDAVGLRLEKNGDYPYFAQDGFPANFLQNENTLLERNHDGGVFRDKDGNVCLECTCGLVISGKTDAASPLFTKGGICWTNDSSSLLDLPSDQDPRMHPRNNCIHQGYASVALIPVRTTERIVGLIQLNDKRQDRFTLQTIEMLEDIAVHIGSALIRRQAEEALRQSEMSLRQVIDLVPHFIFSKDAHGTYLMANKAVADAYGTTSENMLGKSDYDFSQNTEETDFFIQCDKKVIEEGTGLYGIEEVITDAQGSRRFLKTSKIPFTTFGTNTPAILGVSIDITEQNQAEIALKENEQFLKILLESLPLPVFYKDAEGLYKGFNKAFETFFGRPKSELIGCSVFDINPPELAKRYHEKDLELFENVSTQIYEAQVKNDLGKLHDVVFHKASLTNTSGVITGLVGAIMDITERKQSQLALQQKNEEMEQFVYSVSHDLKSPLVTVKTFAGMLRQDLLNADQPQINEDLNYIDKAADKMGQLLDALLQYSHIGTVDALAQTLSVGQSVQNCLGSLAGILQQHEVQVSTRELPQQLQGDPMHFGQIWQNLIENAVKYMGDQALPHIEIGAKKQAQDVVFYVRDNGMGIAPEHSERIFNLFSQLNPGSDGSGLGLALVKKIVTINNGRIWVESAGEGQGSCFMFTLPGALKGNEVTE